MDCEMVGVSPQGNKSALGRVTLVLIVIHSHVQLLHQLYSLKFSYYVVLIVQEGEKKNN